MNKSLKKNFWLYVIYPITIKCYWHSFFFSSRESYFTVYLLINERKHFKWSHVVPFSICSCICSSAHPVFFHSFYCFYQWLSQSCLYGDIFRQSSQPFFTQHPTQMFSIFGFFQYPLNDFLRNTFLRCAHFYCFGTIWVCI